MVQGKWDEAVACFQQGAVRSWEYLSGAARHRVPFCLSFLSTAIIKKNTAWGRKDLLGLHFHHGGKSRQGLKQLVVSHILSPEQRGERSSTLPACPCTAHLFQGSSTAHETVLPASRMGLSASTEHQDSLPQTSPRANLA